jgi:hypothetical protein
MVKEGSEMARRVRGPRLLGVALIIASAVIFAPASWAGAAYAPSAPPAVHARNDAGVALVSWSRPTSNGGAPIKNYVVTSHPLGRTCVSKTTTCRVEHLDSSATYTFSVVARSDGGTSASSPRSNAVRIPSAGDNYLAAVGQLNDAVATEEVAITNLVNATAPISQLNAAFAKLTKAYSSFSSTLKDDLWPAKARAEIGDVAKDEKTVSTDYVDLYSGSAAAAPAVAAALVGADNTATEADVQVRTDLHLPQIVTGPIATTPSPVSYGTSVVLHDFTGDQLSVTVSPIIDPATAANGSGLPSAGTRFVAVEMSLTDVTGGSIAGDANYSTTVVGTDGTTYTADFGGVAECGNFTFGTFQLEGTDSVTGCVVFQLPAAVDVASVNFSLAPGYLDSGEWSY